MAGTLLDLMDTADLTAKAVAAQIGVGPGTVYAWSARAMRPTEARVAALVDLLGVEAADLDAVLCPPKRMGRPRKARDGTAAN